MKMWAGVAFFSLRIYCAGSLKDRRQVVRSLVERARRQFNVSVSDLGPDGVWDRADLGVIFCGSSAQETEHRMDKLVSFIGRGEEDGEFELLKASREVFTYGDI